jgi:hypothetical protein
MLTMAPSRTVEITPHTAIGVSLALLGVVLTLDNLGFVDAEAVMRFWPLIPMLVGAAYVVQGRELREWVIGAGWMAIGTAFLLRNLGVFRFRLSDFLPLILVALGMKVILGRSRRRRARSGPDGAAVGFPGMPDVPPVPPAPPYFGGAASGAGTQFGGGMTAAGGGGAPGDTHGQTLRVFAMLRGTERRHQGPLAHVEVAAVMGGCDVDLRGAMPTADPVILQVFAMWGGIEIRVPPGWLVQNEAWPILGGIVDNTTPPPVPTHRVIVRGNAFMGGVEVKN